MKRKLRFRYYNAVLKQLVITIPTFRHEAMHTSVYGIFTMKIGAMGLWRSWSDGGSTTRSRLGGDAAESDASGGPRQELPGVDTWPTLVIEAGFSQSLEALRNRMHWWFSASQHQVKIVLLVKTDGYRQPILFEKYTEGPATQRPGTTSTRAAAALQPNMDQRIDITRQLGVDWLDSSAYIITRGDLRLEFHLLFLRQPGPGEHDVVLDVQDLQLIAFKIWR